LFNGKLKPYKALVTDINLKGKLSGWDVARRIRETDAASQLVTAVAQLLNAASPPIAPTE